MHNGNIIDSFSGEYRFLSNFYPARVALDGVDYPTVEHAYQAAKTMDKSKRSIICHAETPGKAKRLGRSPLLQFRDDWEFVKVDVMRDLVKQKFSHTDPHHHDLCGELIDTNDALLIEGNKWGDTFWGVCNKVGQNWMGRLLMERRAELISATGCHSCR